MLYISDKRYKEIKKIATYYFKKYKTTDSDIKEYEANLFVMEFMSQIRPGDRDYLGFSPEELQQYICSKLFYS